MGGWTIPVLRSAQRLLTPASMATRWWDQGRGCVRQEGGQEYSQPAVVSSGIDYRVACRKMVGEGDGRMGKWLVSSGC